MTTIKQTGDCYGCGCLSNHPCLYKFLTAFCWFFTFSLNSRSGYFNRRKIMTDLIFIGVIVLFFVVGGLYVRACEKM